MAITLNSVSQSATAGSASFSVAHTVNAGTNRLMLVFVECPNTTDYMATGTVSYGGTNLGAAVVLPPATPTLSMHTYVYRMIAPPVGTANVVVTPSANAYLNVKVITLDGVDQTAPISASNASRIGFAPNSSYSLPITTPSGGLAVGVFICRNTTSTIAAIDGATEIGTITSNTVSRMIASSKENAVSLGYSFTGSQPHVGASAVSLNAASGGGTAPTGTVTIGTITPNSTGASVPFTYSAADQTGFEYRINGGTAVTGTTSPQVLTGLTPSTAYTIEIRAVNATGPGTWSAVGNFTTLTPQAPQGTVTLGIITTGQTTASVPFTYSLADQTGFEYRLNGGTVVTGTVSPQNLTGLTAATAYTIEIRATNGTGAGTWSAAGNFTTAAAPQVPQGTFSVGTISVTETTSSVPYTYSAADQTGIEYRINSGTAITASASPQSVTGLTANTAYTIEFRAINATGNGAWSTAANFTTAAVGAGTFTSEPLHRLVDGALVANTAFTYYRLYSEAGALVVSKTGITSNAAGIVSFTDVAVVAGTKYKSDWLTVDGEFCMPSKAAT